MASLSRRLHFIMGVIFALSYFIVLLSACTNGGSPAPTQPSMGLGKLAFISKGDIYVKALPDGKLRRLTSDRINSKPRWSPSGLWLGFRKGKQVWVMGANGSPAHPLNKGRGVRAFAWAPGADRLAYITESAGLGVVNADGSGRRELVRGGSGRKVDEVAWSPDGKWLAYSHIEHRVYASLWRIRADGRGATEILNAGRPGRPSPDGLVLAGWSPNGSHILYWYKPAWGLAAMADGQPLYAIPVRGGQPRELSQPMLLYADFRAGSPKGDFLAITEGFDRMTWSNKRIVLVDVTKGRRTYLTAKKEVAFSPAWSPDGKRIAYVAGPDIPLVRVAVKDPLARQKAGERRRRIWVMNRDGSAKRQLTNDRAYRDERPLWCRDGSHILFARTDTNYAASLWLMSARGGQPRQVASGLWVGWDSRETMFGFYGYIYWDGAFDWHRG